jgi:hypothetical protein
MTINKKAFRDGIFSHIKSFAKLGFRHSTP